MTIRKHGKLAIARRPALLPLAACAVALLAGCASPRNLLIETTPTAAAVRVTSEHGVSRSGTSPMVVPVDFQYDAFYDIRATAADDAPGGSELRLDRAGFQELPPVARTPDTRRIMLRFDGAPPPADSAPLADSAPPADDAPPADSAPRADAHNLLIYSDPPRAFLDVYDARGALVANGEAPLAMRVDFTESAHYDIRATPAGESEETASLKLDEHAFAALPLTESGVRRAVVVEPGFVMVEEAQEQIALGGEVVRTALKRRSFKDTAEKDGPVPTLIHEFTPGRMLLGMSMSPKGKRIVFAQTMPDEVYADGGGAEDDDADGGGNGARRPPSHLRVLRLGVRGSVQYITTQNFQDGYPSYSPDGKYIFFSSNRRRKNLSDIFRVSTSRQSGISDVLVGHRSARVIRPTVANNGCVAMEFALFDAETRHISDEHYIWTVGGPNAYPTQIAKGYQPSISSDGKRIAYIGTDGNLWMISVTGAERTQLTSDAAAIARRYLNFLGEEERAAYEAAVKGVTTAPNPPYGHPSWSSDNRYILYASMAGNDPTGRPNEDIWVIDTRDGQKHQLTTNGSVDKYPLMTPDKKSIYFVSNRGERWGLWRIKVKMPAK